MNEKMERLLTILQDVNDEIDFAHERHMVDDGLIDSLELMKIIVALEEAYEWSSRCPSTASRWPTTSIWTAAPFPKSCAKCGTKV